MTIQKEILNSYHLPWTEFDNPNGWIEPLNTCNIVCPGCYRGADKQNQPSEFIELDELKKQIDWFKQNRNVHTISIAGGEPTLYPHLKDLIAYAFKLNIRTMLFTNGVILTREYAVKLVEHGLNQVVIHVDKFQKRPDMTDCTAMELRQKFVDRFKDIPNLQLGFIQPISQGCESELAMLMEFSKKNFSAINLMIFTVYRNICETSEIITEIENNITIADLLTIIRKYVDVKPAAYLNSAGDSNETTWLFTQQIGVDGVIFGNVSSSLFKKAHQSYRQKNKRHIFISRKNTIQMFSLFRFFYKLSVIKIFANFCKYILKTGRTNNSNINFQTFLLLRGPEKQHGKWDLCEGCPDRMIYNGKLVPSCILENIKQKQNNEFEQATI